MFFFDWLLVESYLILFSEKKSCYQRLGQMDVKKQVNVHTSISPEKENSSNHTHYQVDSAVQEM